MFPDLLPTVIEYVPKFTFSELLVPPSSRVPLHILLQQGDASMERSDDIFLLITVEARDSCGQETLVEALSLQMAVALPNIAEELSTGFQK